MPVFLLCTFDRDGDRHKTTMFTLVRDSGVTWSSSLFKCWTFHPLVSGGRRKSSWKKKTVAFQSRPSICLIYQIECTPCIKLQIMDFPAQVQGNIFQLILMVWHATNSDRYQFKWTVSVPVLNLTQSELCITSTNDNSQNSICETRQFLNACTGQKKRGVWDDNFLSHSYEKRRESLEDHTSNHSNCFLTNYSTEK